VKTIQICVSHSDWSSFAHTDQASENESDGILLWVGRCNHGNQITLAARVRDMNNEQLVAREPACAGVHPGYLIHKQKCHSALPSGMKKISWMKTDCQLKWITGLMMPSALVVIMSNA